ncbi:MAG: sulfite exporter TauE/SafE family protein, partial [Nitrospirae bacterium]|nr:sulfite exporter TauE/SafE family protein [Nitrospirota bacterium]
MSPIIIYIGAFAAAVMTLMTGFGVGTVLTPIFTFFFEVQIAILMVAVIHFSNNLFKLYLFRKHVNKEIILKFGLL